MNRPSPSHARAASSALLLPLMLALLATGALFPASCSNVRVLADNASRLNLVEYETFAFVDSSAETDELEARIEAAAEKELSEIGLRRVERGDARLMVVYDTVVEVETRYLDPFERAFYSHERFEEGTLLLEMIDAADDGIVWSGSAQAQLRVVARGSGVEAIHYEPTGEERKWEIEEKVRRLLKRFPRP